MDNDIEILNEILKILSDQRDKINVQLNENLFKIQEINFFLKNLTEKEDENFKVFSPRNIESVHKDQIEDNNKKKQSYEEEIEEYRKKLSFLNLIIEKLNIVIKNLQSGQNQKDSDREEAGDYHIAHQILNCVSYIISDPMRAKIELTAIAKRMSHEEHNI